MPILSWASKSPLDPPPAGLVEDAVVYPAGAGYPGAAPRSRLIWGENLAVMGALLEEFEGQVDLIYADPPFYTNRRFPARVGRGEDSRRPQDWQLAEGYPDAWPSLDAYLDMLYPRLVAMYHLLAPTGMLYLHLDWHANAYARLLLDEIFGAERLLNEIIWVYHGPSPIRSAFNRKHDTILAYTKSSEYTFNVDAVRQPYDPATVKTFASSSKAGFGKIPDLERGKVPEDWWYFPVVARLHNERTGYPTQKPLALLERILLASSNPGDLTADFFCGSGVAAEAAARLGRRFIACDAARRAVDTAYARLARAEGEPFAFHRAAGLPPPVAQEAAPASRQEGAVCLHSASPDWEFWEVDPAWDGGAFRSAAQASRPRRKGDMPDRLALPQVDGAQPALLRWITAAGEHFQADV
ncbi:MAG: site-specific DNA-methyltransferase [Chloroflexi bacterium]|nr:site-specific DNA-methyltransferase [Chloroflexota bacterium]